MELHNTILLYGIDVLLEEDKGEIYVDGEAASKPTTAFS